MLRFKVHLDGFEKIENKVNRSCTEAEHIVAQRIRSDTSPYVPARDLVLDNTTRVVDNRIIYQQPYAHYLYYGKLRVDPETGSSYAKKGGTKVLTNKNLVFSKAKHSQAQSHWFEASKAENLEEWLKTAQKAVNNENKRE